jgi:hypothetical protein
LEKDQVSMIRTFAIASLLLLSGGTAQAQNCLGRPDFDVCMQGFVAQQQNQLARSQQQLFQAYIAQNQDWLERNYAAHRAAGGTMSFEQFAYWGMMTANGTNLQGAQQAQQDWFQGQQKAHGTIQQGNADYNSGSRANSDATDRALHDYGEGAIRGNAPYVDPNSGETRWLPYAAQPGQPFNLGGEVYVRAQDGAYYQRQGNAWIQMEPGR